MIIKDLDVFKPHYDLYIGGKWTKGHGEDRLKSINPANGQVLTDFVDATNADVDDAIKAAQDAFPAWKKTSAAERAAILNKIGDLIDEKTDLLSLQETLDNGKPIRETRYVDIPYGADHFRYFAAAIRAEEGTVNQIDKDTISIVLREPLGVVGQIVPWNFPFLMAAWKIAPALAAGNTIVIHPSSSTSLSLLSLAELIDKAHLLPAGVLNVVTGKGSKSGEYMQHHKGLRKLAFTGSTAVGREIALSAAQNLIPSTLELGGKSANIIFDDAPYERAIEGAVKGILFNQGQVCCAGSRILVQEGIYDKFVKDLVAAFKKVKIGLPWDTETQMGAQVNGHQCDTIDKYVRIGEKEGKILVGGHRLSEGVGKGGSYYEPTLIAAGNDTVVAQDEIFGPVAVVTKFKDAADAIAIANDSKYGLGGAVWTTNLDTAFRVGEGVETGRVWVNTYNEIPAGAPFGGYKESGIGRETHKLILDAYSQVKNIFISLKTMPDGLYK